MMKIPNVQRVAKGTLLWNADSCAAVGPCGHCEELCPTGILSIGGAMEGILTLDKAICVRCRLCLVACPTASLSFSPEPPGSIRMGQEAFFQR